MCSPELTRGMCQVCYGTLLPENTHIDRYGNVWDVHKGVCAIEAGDMEVVSPYHRDTYLWYMDRIHEYHPPDERQVIINQFKRWIREIAPENHEEKCEPSNMALAERPQDPPSAETLVRPARGDATRSL